MVMKFGGRVISVAKHRLGSTGAQVRKVALSSDQCALIYALLRFTEMVSMSQQAAQMVRTSQQAAQMMSQQADQTVTMFSGRYQQR